ncbi:MAG: T9SS type A sorting domain-containing protein, partial [Winogradskyella sp.]|nr:T9SS type A sorting domain-containing protein [Winogradskyella sp.]
SDTAFPLLGNPLTIRSAEDAFTYVTANAGANAYLNENGESIANLDSLDEMYLNNVIQGECVSYTSYSSYQDYPENQHYIDFHNSVSNVPINTGYADSNMDGIPDAWVVANGFGVNDDLTTYQWPSGYVGIEEFLNEIDANAIQVVDVTGVEVTPPTATINIPETVQLSYSIQPSDATNQNGAWTSSDESIATVTNTGLVEPVSAGDVVITFTSNDGSFSDSAQITVTNIIIPIESISISPENSVIDISETVQLNTLITPSNATFQNGTWTSTDENIATVDENGLVTGVSEGVATISFTSDFDNAISSSAIINVVDIFFGTYELYNATSDELIDVITNDTSFNLDLIGDQINFRSTPQGGDANPDVESVMVSWTGAENGTWSESVPIYAGMTNHVDFDFDPYTVIEGTYNFTITYHSEDSGQGTVVAGDTFSITFFRGLNVTIEGQDSICQGDNTTLVANTNLGVSFLWSTGETTQSIEVGPTETTTYTVTVSDDEGNTVEDTVEIIVNTIPTANAGIDETICQGESVVLSATGGSSYLWSTGATSATIEVSPNSTIDYSVEVFNGNCSDIDIVTVNVISAPQISTSGDITIVEGDSVTLTVTGSDNYLWSTGETTDSIEVNPNETTTYSVTSTNANNCSTTEEITVTVVPTFEASAGADQRICDQSGDQVVLTASNADTYVWSTGETSQSIVVSPSSTTTYMVTATLGTQVDTASVTVFVDPNPNVTIINGDSADILVGEFITLSATGANTYEWSNGATQPNIAVSPTQTTTFQVRGYINDCYEEEEITVNVYQQVNAYAGEDVTICLDDSIVLTATGGDEYLWSTGETTQSIEVTPQETTEFTVTVFNAIDFDESSVTVEVDIECEETAVEPGENPTEFNFKVYPVPAVDYFTIDIRGMSDDAELFLYDITGKLMLKEVLISDNNYYNFSKDINVSNIRSGIYFLHLIEENNPNPEILKLIIN